MTDAELGPLYQHAQRTAFPDMTAKDHADLTSATDRILALLRDGLWHTRMEVDDVGGQLDNTRRLRELRQRGHQIDVRRPSPENRQWLYRLAVEA